MRIAIVNDLLLATEALRRLLTGDGRHTVAWIAHDGEEAVARCAEDRPDLILMDLQMPRLDGIEATRRITADRADPDVVTAVLVLTTFDHDDALYGALRSGASGYMLKHAAPTSLADAVRRVADGEAWIDPSVAGKVIATLRQTVPVDASGRPTLEMLSKREVEVLRLMGDGPTNAELASALFVSEATVKTHISRLLMKTGSHDRAQLVALAYKSGLVRP